MTETTVASSPRIVGVEPSFFTVRLHLHLHQLDVKVTPSGGHSQDVVFPDGPVISQDVVLPEFESVLSQLVVFPPQASVDVVPSVNAAVAATVSVAADKRRKLILRMVGPCYEG